MTCKEYAVANGLVEYADLIDRITIKYIIENPEFRKQLALNGFNFIDIKIKEQSLIKYAEENNLSDLSCFLEHVGTYQVN